MRKQAKYRMNDTSSKIGRWQGAGLLATTLLGTGVFILPQMTIAIAGNGALITWLVLTLAIIPVTLVFGRLAAKYPHAAGPAFFVEKAFGPIAGRTIGLLFLLIVPLGVPAAILMTFQFVEPLVELSSFSQLLCQLSVLLLLLVLNYRGIQVSAKLQFTLTLAIITVIVVLFGVSATSNSVTPNFNLVFNSENGLNINLIMAAAGIAFWSFLGVEAMTHLANDFKDPKKDLLPAMMIGTIWVGLIYLACTLLLLLFPSESDLAMVGTFNIILGDFGGGMGAQVIGILGITGGLASTNVYTASVSRLVWSFSNDRVLPGYFSKLNQHKVPVRALNLTLITMAVVLTLSFIFEQNLEDLIAWCNGIFVVIYFASMLAAIKLLERKNYPFILLGCLFCLMLGWGLGFRMIYAFILLFSTATLLWWQYTTQNKKLLTV